MMSGIWEGTLYLPAIIVKIIINFSIYTYLNPKFPVRLGNIMSQYLLNS